MSKRSSEMTSKFAATKKKQRHWSLGLKETLKDPSNIVRKSERAVVVEDKYPKAQIHYLILPKEDINSIFDLNYTHIDLLQEFEQLYEGLKLEHEEHTLRAGFHAMPSMQLLHMHVISTDMISPYLKTKQHWNSFSTRYFVSYADIIQQLKKKGCIQKMSEAEQKSLLSTPLKCNECSYVPSNMPDLKQHLLTH